MNKSYLEQVILTLLKRENGNTSLTRKALMKVAMQDNDVLRALTQHHLSGIVAYHIEKVARDNQVSAKPKTLYGVENKSPKLSSSSKSPKSVHKMRSPQSHTPKSSKAFGTDMLKAMTAHDATVFGLEGYAGSSPKKNSGKAKVSQSHIDAIMKIAGNVKSH